jgi:hypothetical protein
MKNLGYALAKGLLDQTSSVDLFEYQVRLQDGRDVVVVREWGNDAPGDCVKVFESSTPRKDYPRMVRDTCRM